MDNVTKEVIIANFRQRNISAEFYNNVEDVNNRILELIPQDCSIGVGHSTTLEQMEIMKKLSDRGNIMIDKSSATNHEQMKVLKKKALTADWYISSSNAVSMDGQIVNIDHSGNRVASLMYGPDKVIIVVGVNKIADNLDKAIDRAKNIAAVKNAKRAGYKPPCVYLNKCVDCTSSERICNYLTVIQGQHDKDRLRVLIIDKELGF
ncbi:lactate utilization protein [Vallitalea longa]|uniref:Lactate utilization protein n=1 Tax=Vallitalea longa TaxID=2936439 RepID=A0A9W6DFJ3_9FIRM|nr:lactate utilization protein [Vallitalea longa]GKX29537.1 lactate utilization protein [Vallitalea longa]